MLPFTVSLRAGQPIFDQVVYAVARAIATRQLQAGDAFPSVRTLSQALKINPNTAHKIVAALTEEGLLVVRPGIGTVVGGPKSGSAAARRTILNHDAERLVVDARHAGLSLEQLLQAIRRHWKEMQ
jgi:DNA-binding transcriptional regulator YhcF (GntR family)